MALLEHEVVGMFTEYTVDKKRKNSDRCHDKKRYMMTPFTKQTLSMVLLLAMGNVLSCSDDLSEDWKSEEVYNSERRFILNYGHSVSAGGSTLTLDSQGLRLTRPDGSQWIADQTAGLTSEAQAQFPTLSAGVFGVYDADLNLTFSIVPTFCCMTDMILDSGGLRFKDESGRVVWEDSDILYDADNTLTLYFGESIVAGGTTLDFDDYGYLRVTYPDGLEWRAPQTASVGEGGYVEYPVVSGGSTSLVVRDSGGTARYELSVDGTGGSMVLDSDGIRFKDGSNNLQWASRLRFDADNELTLCRATSSCTGPTSISAGGSTLDFDDEGFLRLTYPDGLTWKAPQSESVSTPNGKAVFPAGSNNNLVVYDLTTPRLDMPDEITSDTSDPTMVFDSNGIYFKDESDTILWASRLVFNAENPLWLEYGESISAGGSTLSFDDDGYFRLTRADGSEWRASQIEPSGDMGWAEFPSYGTGEFVIYDEDYSPIFAWRDDEGNQIESMVLDSAGVRFLDASGAVIGGFYSTQRLHFEAPMTHATDYVDSLSMVRLGTTILDVDLAEVDSAVRTQISEETSFCQMAGYGENCWYRTWEISPSFYSIRYESGHVQIGWIEKVRISNGGVGDHDSIIFYERDDDGYLGFSEVLRVHDYSGNWKPNGATTPSNSLATHLDGIQDVTFDWITTHPKNYHIELTTIPPMCDTETNLAGRVYSDLTNLYVAVLIRVNDRWYVKPGEFYDLTAVASDGTFEIDVATAGVDEAASEFALFVLTDGMIMPPVDGLVDIPEYLYAHSLANNHVVREPKTLTFADRIWTIKNSCEGLFGPGFNIFSDDVQDVHTDVGRLHLNCAQHSGSWYATEVITKVDGYGHYSFTIDSAVHNLDDRVVFGAFTWDTEADTEAFREIDFEIAQWPLDTDQSIDPEFNTSIYRQNLANDPHNAQFAVQLDPPPEAAVHRFSLGASSGGSTHGFEWTEDGINFFSEYGAASHEWSYTWDDGFFPDGSRPLEFRFNLWIYRANITGNVPAGNTEVIISDFVYDPY